jgi:hypothetical protein
MKVQISDAFVALIPVAVPGIYSTCNVLHVNFAIDMNVHGVYVHISYPFYRFTIFSLHSSSISLTFLFFSYLLPFLVRFDVLADGTQR